MGFLVLDNFSCGYYKSFRLDPISFDITRGAFAGIIGPNGSGKTTLFKGISGELKRKSGSICLNNADLGNISIREKARNIAVVTQNTEATDISVEEYVLMGRLPYRDTFQFFESKNDLDIADHYMKLTDVYQHRNKLMSELSGGEQQLAAIARALTQEPSLLLLDEPTSHLDISHQVQILNLLQKLNDDLNLTVLMIIHDLNLAGEYCDYLVMMSKGDVYIKGTPEEVLTYTNIEQVYNTVVFTQPNPLSKKPAVFLVSDKIIEQSRK